MESNDDDDDDDGDLRLFFLLSFESDLERCLLLCLLRDSSLLSLRCLLLLSLSIEGDYFLGLPLRCLSVGERLRLNLSRYLVSSSFFGTKSWILFSAF